MSQTTVKSTQISGDQNKRRGASEMMTYYLAAGPSTTTDRLVQGNLMSDKDIMSGLKQKELELDALMRQLKGGRPR
ncbi:hypothetical protein F4677DRAFT_447130 [Hypoxylon crocopeplum]|nr:hypothetical protein F4677DRAFT_447130 [Hypoxylon crocopeplum]